MPEPALLSVPASPYDGWSRREGIVEGGAARPLPGVPSAACLARSKPACHISSTNSLSLEIVAGLARYSRRVPCRRSVTRWASRRTLRCCETADRVTAKCSAISPAGSSVAAMRWRIARRVGSAIARRTMSRSSPAGSCPISPRCMRAAVQRCHRPTCRPSGSLKVAILPMPGMS